LIVFVWWIVDREALERRIRRLEARSEIAEERRVTTQTDLTEVEHKLDEIEGRVVDVENLTSPANAGAK
jgi:septal ring factor EnvC (AmiA/AmiB activator)